MISNSAQRASLVPSYPRISVYISKPNYTHDLVYGSGVFGIHLLRTDQWDLIWQLGFQSGRDVDKLRELDVVDGTTGCPMLTDCVAAFECKVVNAMDTGASTFFLGDVVHVRSGVEGPIMSSEYFRANMPAERLAQYEANLKAAGATLEKLTRDIDPTRTWPGTVVNP